MSPDGAHDEWSAEGVPLEDRTPRRRQAALVSGLVAAVLLTAAFAALYVFGTPSSGAGEPAYEDPPIGMPATPPGTGGDGSRASGVEPGTEAPPADPASPLAIQIPGCVCHSDDPKLVEEHSHYRMNQCAGCHIGGVSMGR